MRESDFEQEQIAPVRTHEEILELIEEIKDIEKEFNDFELERPLAQEWDISCGKKFQEVPRVIKILT